MRQEYSRETLQQLLDDFPDKGKITEYMLAKSGFENSNYCLTTDRGTRYALKIYEIENAAHDTIFFEIDVMTRAHAAGIKTPGLHQTQDGKSHTLLGNKVVILMDFIAGQNLDKTIIDDCIAEDIGTQAGKMDTLLGDIRDGSRTRQDYEFDLKNILNLAEDIQHLPTENDRKAVRDILARFQAEKSVFDALPCGIIHNDIVLHNLLGTPNQLAAIIDFSDMAFSPYAQNISVTFSQTFFCANWQPHQAGIFLECYQKHKTLSAEERRLLYILTLARHAQLALAFTNWNRRFGEDLQRTEAIADYCSFMHRLIGFGENNFHTHIKI